MPINTAGLMPIGGLGRAHPAAGRAKGSAHPLAQAPLAACSQAFGACSLCSLLPLPLLLQG
jgi:hypothetical protein